MRELTRTLVVTMVKVDRSDPSRASELPPAHSASTAPGSGRPGADPLLGVTRQLLTATQVQGLLGIDRSTVYRMADDGRLAGVKIGRQWRFPAERVQALLVPDSAGDHTSRVGAGTDLGRDPVRALDLAAARPLLEVASYLLGVMMLVADMQGRPLTSVANPCAWFEERSGDAEVMEACSAKWHAMAEDPDLTPRFRVGAMGVECAHAFIRSGNTLVGMVLAGGVAPESSPMLGLHRLDAEQRSRALDTLPRVAVALSGVAPR